MRGAFCRHAEQGASTFIQCAEEVMNELANAEAVSSESVFKSLHWHTWIGIPGCSSAVSRMYEQVEVVM